jgi:hypothetical protein
MASCEDTAREDVNMTGIEEIQAQNGNSIYTGTFANFSNLNVLEHGYGIWVKGNMGTLFTSKQGLNLPVGFEYQTINNSNEVVETTLNGLTIRLYVNYLETANAQAIHSGVVVNVDGVNSSLMLIQGTYEGHELVVGIYDTDGKLVGVSERNVIDGNMVLSVNTVGNGG